MEYVILTKVSTVTNAVVALLGQWCATLTYLHLQGCVQVTDVSPLSRCPKLFRLDIAGCGRVSAVSQVQLREALKSLQIIHQIVLS